MITKPWEKFWEKTRDWFWQNLKPRPRHGTNTLSIDRDGRYSKNEGITAVKRVVFCSFVFLLGMVVSLMLYDKIELPFSNPWDIKGPVAAIKYNPHNDILRFVLVVAFPSIFLLALTLNKYVRGLCISKVARFGSVENNKKKRKSAELLVYLLLFSALLVQGGNTYRVQPLDTFHEGETLGPAIDYLNGEIPYKDFVFIHGVFHEPLRSVLAFKLFGQSIGSLRTLESLLGIVTLCLFTYTLHVLFKRNIHFTSISFGCLMVVNYLYPAKIIWYITYIEIPLLLFLIVAVKIRGVITETDQGIRRIRTHLLLFFFTFIPTLSFANSIDRGFFLSTAATLYSIGIYWVFIRKTDWKYLVSLLAGYVFGLVCVGMAIRWAFYDFVQYVVVLLRYEPLMNGYVYPFLRAEFLLPVLLLSITLYWLTGRFIETYWNQGRQFFNASKIFYVTHFLELLLFILAVFYFRRALGRADGAHLGGVTFAICILGGYVVMKHFTGPFFERRKRKQLLLTVASVFVLGFFFTVATPAVDWKNWYRFPLAFRDEAFIPMSYQPAIVYLKKGLGHDEDFLTLTSEASWYYFLDKPCPIRFALIYQAMPHFYQEEIVRTLKSRNIKYVPVSYTHLTLPTN